MYIVAKINELVIYSHSSTQLNIDEVKTNVEKVLLEMGYLDFVIVESDTNPFDDKT